MDILEPMQPAPIIYETFENVFYPEDTDLLRGNILAC